MIIVLLVMGAVVATVVATVAGGLLLPARHVVQRRRTVPLAIDDAWARLADPARYAAWQRRVRSVDLLATQPLRWREFTDDGALAWEAVSLDAPSRLVVRAIDDDVQRRPERVLVLEPAGGGTHVTCTEAAHHGNPITRFVYRYLLRPEPVIDALLADLARAAR
jgi:hypothetical protein